MMVSVHKTCEPYIRFCGPYTLYLRPLQYQPVHKLALRAIAGGAAVRRVQYHE
jgi:hypothetical protein